jgi:hypothetical protein
MGLRQWNTFLNCHAHISWTPTKFWCPNPFCWYLILLTGTHVYQSYRLCSSAAIALPSGSDSHSLKWSRSFPSFWLFLDSVTCKNLYPSCYKRTPPFDTNTNQTLDSGKLQRILSSHSYKFWLCCYRLWLQHHIFNLWLWICYDLEHVLVLWIYDYW